MREPSLETPGHRQMQSMLHKRSLASRHEPGENEVDAVVPSMGATISSNSTSSPTVAIVDDDPRIRRLLEDELTELGYGVNSFDNGFSLIEDLSHSHPALILLDLLMPQMDGIECLKRIRENSFTGPVLVFTALSDNEKRQEAQLEGANDYILKPDLFENLSAILGEHLTD